MTKEDSISLHCKTWPIVTTLKTRRPPNACATRSMGIIEMCRDMFGRYNRAGASGAASPPAKSCSSIKSKESKIASRPVAVVLVVL